LAVGLCIVPKCRDRVIRNDSPTGRKTGARISPRRYFCLNFQRLNKFLASLTGFEANPMVRAPSRSREGQFRANLRPKLGVVGVPAQDPETLRELGKRLDEVQTRQTQRDIRPPPTQLGIAFRFATELVAALLVGGGLGWGIDWAVARWSPFHTRPLFTVVFFILGAAAGIRGVMRAASEINAEISGHGPVASAKDDDEEN